MFSTTIKKSELKTVLQKIAEAGFTDFLHQHNLTHWLPYRHFRRAVKNQSWPEASALSQLLLALGPGYVEAGRIVGSRSDLVPSQYQADLLHLRSYPALLSPLAIKNLLKRQLATAPERLFSHFDSVPCRRHALGSTHQAVLRDGRRVLVTLNYPVEVKIWLANLTTIKWLLARLVPKVEHRHRLAWQSVGEELADRAHALADLTQVAGRLEIFAAHFSGGDKFLAPAALWPYTTPRLLVQRWHDAPPLRAPVYAKSYVARYVLESFVYQYGILGHFLLRPSLDDFSVLGKNQILANNFLEIGRLEPVHRRQFILLLWALLQDDFNLASRVLLQAHYNAARHHDAHRAGVVLTKAKTATFAEKLWHTLEKGWQGQLSIPLSFTMAAESLLFLETMIGAVHPDGDFSGNLLSAIKKHAPVIFSAPKSATLKQIATTVIF